MGADLAGGSALFFPAWPAPRMGHSRIHHLCRGRVAIDTNVRRLGADVRHSPLGGTGFTPTLRRCFHDMRESCLFTIS